MSLFGGNKGLNMTTPAYLRVQIEKSKNNSTVGLLVLTQNNCRICFHSKGKLSSSLLTRFMSSLRELARPTRHSRLRRKNRRPLLLDEAAAAIVVLKVNCES